MARTDYTFIRLQRISGTWRAWDAFGAETTSGRKYYIDQISNLKRLIREYGKDTDDPIIIKLFSDGRTRVTREVDVSYFPDGPYYMEATGAKAKKTKKSPTVALSKEELELVNMIHTSTNLRPKKLVLSDIKWKYLVRSVMRGKNLMMTGPTGCGKTLAATSVATALGRQLFRFNLGATQDPRSTLIGNTHFNKSTGTYFADSTFVKAIQTENAVILLDELSRAHPEAWNILMTVTDETQRYLRIDEAPDVPVITVAKGVCFLATANVGMEYTSTRTMDRAILDRFALLEMDLLSQDQQQGLISDEYPDLDPSIVKILASIYTGIHNEVVTGNGRLSTSISTRVILQAAGLLVDGFNLIEAAEVSIYPYYSNDGGAESERTYVKQLVQKYVPDSALKNSKMFGSSAATR
jgi:MoxR-like ATPase